MDWFNTSLQKFNLKLSFLEKFLCLWGIVWGALGLVLYFIGLVSLFYRPVVIGLFILFVIIFFYLAARLKIWPKGQQFFKNTFEFFKKDPLLIIFSVIFIFFVIINLIAALAPELGYDALWYHLTLPKIYFMTHQIRYLAGVALYYSVMPRLGEMFFGVGLAFDPTGIFAKLIHWSFGLAWFAGVYIFLRLFLSRRYSLIAAMMVYGTIVVSWLSQVAYIDLIVAFYVLLSLWGFWRFLQTKDHFFLDLSAIFMGLNLASKIYGLFIYGVMTISLLFKAGWKRALRFALMALIFVLPFYFQALLATGNPIYPVFAIRDSALDMYLAGYHSLREWYFHAWWQLLPKLLWRVLVYDFTPVFGLILLLPLAKKRREMTLPLLIFLAFFLFWSIVPVHEPRYFLVILPLVALMVGYVIENINFRLFHFLSVCFILALLILFATRIFQDYRKTFPVVFGKESRQDYLKKNIPLRRIFYDQDQYFQNNLGPQDKVLTAEVGNMFYLDFKFWDWSFVKDKASYLESAQILSNKLKSEGFTSILLGKKTLPEWTGFDENEIDNFFEPAYSSDFFKFYRIK